MRPLLTAIGWALVLACGFASEPVFSADEKILNGKTDGHPSQFDCRKEALLGPIPKDLKEDPTNGRANMRQQALNARNDWTKCEALTHSASFWEHAGKFQDDAYRLQIPELGNPNSQFHPSCSAEGMDRAYQAGYRLGIQGQRYIVGTAVLSKEEGGGPWTQTYSAYSADRTGCAMFVGASLDCCSRGGRAGFVALTKYLVEKKDNVQSNERTASCQVEFEIGRTSAIQYCEDLKDKMTCHPSKHGPIRYLSCYHAGFNFELARQTDASCPGIDNARSWFQKNLPGINVTQTQKPNEKPSTEEPKGEGNAVVADPAPKP